MVNKIANIQSGAFFLVGVNLIHHTNRSENRKIYSANKLKSRKRYGGVNALVICKIKCSYYLVLQILILVRGLIWLHFSLTIQLIVQLMNGLRTRISVSIVTTTLIYTNIPTAVNFYPEYRFFNDSMHCVTIYTHSPYIYDITHPKIPTRHTPLLSNAIPIHINEYSLPHHMWSRVMCAKRERE